MKLLYAIASALFCVAAPVAAPAQSLDLSLMLALCSDDYYEDTAGQCGAISAGEVFTIEAILAKYGVVITGDTDDEAIVFLFDDPAERRAFHGSLTMDGRSIPGGHPRMDQPARPPKPPPDWLKFKNSDASAVKRTGALRRSLLREPA